MKLRNKKTGAIGELSGVNRIVVYEPDMPLCGNSILGTYDTLAQLNEEWEDYKEPLIKDEKIRKAVRAWAEANSLDEIICFPHEDSFDFAGNATKLDIRFNQPLEIDDSRGYTITELCGENEE